MAPNKSRDEGQLVAGMVRLTHDASLSVRVATPSTTVAAVGAVDMVASFHTG